MIAKTLSKKDYSLKSLSGLVKCPMCESDLFDTSGDGIRGLDVEVLIQKTCFNCGWRLTVERWFDEALEDLRLGYE